MTAPTTSAAERIERVSRVFAERRSRLAEALVHRPRPVASQHPLARLQRQGYPAAVGLALVAVAPAALRFLFRRRKLLWRAATAALKLRKWRTRLGDAPAAASRREPPRPASRAVRARRADVRR